MNRVRRLSRIPIRLRLTLVFAVSMAVVLTATGGLLYQRLSGALDASLNNGLYARTADVGTRVRNGDTRLDNAAHDDEHFSQVLTDTGRQRAATPGLGEAFELPAAALHAAVGHRVILDGLRATGSDDRFRVLAEPVDTPTGRSVIVIAASLDPRAEVLAGLRAQLLLGGALALTLASLAGYAVAAAALRPVEAMRREAAAVSATEPGRRLPLPAADDEITRLGQTLNDMLGRLETVLAGERRFIAEASHELRTPLALLRTEVELALRRGRSAEELAQALRSVAEETDRLSRLAEDLLVLARGQGSRLTLRRERLAAGELLARVRERFAAQASAIGRELEVTGDDGAHLFADRLRSEQALTNLVDNALRHGRGGIGLSARRRDGRVELHVTDEGPGMPPGLAERAFEPFSRGEAARSGPGAGLGLPIVDVIAQAHGGTVHAANNRHGADVWICLPAAGP